VRAGWRGQAGPGFILRGYGLHNARKGHDSSCAPDKPLSKESRMV
jgi:hypothetical protein